MAGIYIHIPFCSTRCLYCDFFSNTRMEYKDSFLSAIIKEIELRKDYLDGDSIDTIYFGGGTPSQLSAIDFQKIFNMVYSTFTIKDDAEITIEANPDDMTDEYISALQYLPFNRISMGVQSFNDKDLRFLNRRHDVAQAIRAVCTIQEKGYDNISLDLMYGLPGQTVADWEKSISEAIRLNIPHISAYHLIYEEGTPLYRLKEAGKVSPVDENVSLQFFNTLIDRLTEAGYMHYEISNFAKPGAISRHNSSYWTGKKYIGIGPSAHSYNTGSRQWNISSLPLYIKGIEVNAPDIEVEMLNNNNKYNDYIITGLRTMWGINISYILTNFGRKMQDYLLEQAAPAIDRGLLRREGDKLLFSREGLFISDSIMSDLLWV